MAAFSITIADRDRFPIYVDTPEGRRAGYINRSGDVVIPPTFQQASEFRDGCALVRDPGEKQSYYIDEDGEVVFRRDPVPALGGRTFMYWRCREFSDGLASVGEPRPDLMGYRFGYIDATGQYAIPPDFALASPFQGGVARAAIPTGKNQPNRSVCIDTTGREISEAEYEARIERFKYLREGLMQKHIGERGGTPLYSYVNESGETVLEGPFANPKLFSCGLARVGIFEGGGRHYEDRVINRQGQVISMPATLKADFSEGLAAVSVSKRVNGDVPRHLLWGVGYVDTEGTLVIPPRFKEGGSFHEGRAWVLIDQPPEFVDQFAFIDRAGRYVVEPGEGAHAEFRGGLAAIGDRGYMDRSGNLVWTRPKPP